MGQVRPLAGVKVVERTGRLAGTVCARILHEFGAEVSRVAVKGDPDPNEPRDWQQHPFTSAWTGCTELDESASDFDETWREIAANSDIVILTRTLDDTVVSRALPGTMESTTCQQIVCVVSAFGMGVPDEYVPVADPSEAEMQATGGLLATTGDTTGRPVVVELPVLEIFAGINAATSAVAALLTRSDREGQGQLIDTAVFDAAFALTGVFLGDVLGGNARGFRKGCRHSLVVPWNAYPVLDGWVIICTTSDPQWQAMLEEMGQPEFGSDARFATAPDRMANVEAVDALVSEWTRGKTAAEAISALRSRGIPIGSVSDVAALAKQDPPSPCRLREAPSSASRTAATRTNRRGQGHSPPCTGLRVLEVGPYTAGPLAGRYRANLGAEVIKVDPPGGETSRGWEPKSGGVSGYFGNYNAGKASVTLDLRSQAGKQALGSLIASSDVLLHNLRTGAMERLGFGIDEVFRINPQIINCGISGYGATGAKLPALDTVIQAEAGLISLIEADDAPVKAGFSIADLAAAHISPVNILAALHHCRRTGRGVALDVSMFDAVAWMTQLAWPSGVGTLPPAMVVEASDGWVLAQTDGSRLADIITSKDAGDLKRCEVVTRLAANGIRATSVLELDEVHGLPVVSHRSLLRRGGKDETCLTAAPFNLSKTPVTHDFKVAVAGADTSSLLASTIART